MKTVFDFKGFRIQFPVGVRQDVMGIVLTHDDGTSGNFLIIEFNDIPYAAIPIANKDGLDRMIDALKRISKEGFKD